MNERRILLVPAAPPFLPLLFTTALSTLCGASSFLLVAAPAPLTDWSKLSWQGRSALLWRLQLQPDQGSLPQTGAAVHARWLATPAENKFRAALSESFACRYLRAFLH